MTDDETPPRRNIDCDRCAPECHPPECHGKDDAHYRCQAHREEWRP